MHIKLKYALIISLVLIFTLIQFFGLLLCSTGLPQDGSTSCKTSPQIFEIISFPFDANPIAYLENAIIWYLFRFIMMVTFVLIVSPIFEDLIKFRFNKKLLLVTGAIILFTIIYAGIVNVILIPTSTICEPEITLANPTSFPVGCTDIIDRQLLLHSSIALSTIWYVCVLAAGYWYKKRRPLLS